MFRRSALSILTGPGDWFSGGSAREGAVLPEAVTAVAATCDVWVAGNGQSVLRRRTSERTASRKRPL